MIDISSMYKSELDEFVSSKLAAPKYRSAQIASWLKRGVTSFEEMTDLPKALIEKLNSICYISVANIEKKLVSSYDETVKYLFSFSDKECVEAVVMKYNHGYSMCISTQVGCKMGCTFCATGLSGFVRNLSAGEMLSQILSAQSDLGLRISNVVLMGMGEPLDNYDNVVRFIRLVSSEYSLNIGTRHITLSTCGIAPRIYDFAEEGFGTTLSLSLHAPNDEIRSKTMPVNKRYPISEAVKACKYYAQTTGRRVTYEYAMISDVNDSARCAEELGALLKGSLCHVNLIPVNPVENTGYSPSNDKRISVFRDVLSRYNINSTVRRTLGADINASCGQLRGKNKK